MILPIRSRVRRAVVHFRVRDPYGRRTAWAAGMRRVVAGAWLVLLAAGVCFGQAEPLADDAAVEAGAEALQGPISFPWYDAEADSIRRLDVEPPADLKNRHSEWLRTQRQKTKRQSTNNAALKEALWTCLRVLGWTAVVVALVTVGYLLVRTFLSGELGAVGSTERRDGVEDLRGDVDRVESLPFQLQQPQDDLLTAARKHYEAGNYSEAIVYFYSYQLVELDKHQLIRLTKGKTNRQYLREVRRRGELSGLLQRTMLMFEDVFFGNHPLERSRFESVWQDVNLFHNRLEQAMA